jgi:lipid A ethanolaminephosphotransferase
MLSIRSLSFRVSHSRFSLVFAALLYATCNALNMSALTKWFQGKDGLDVAAFAAYLLAGYGLFAAVFLLLSHRWTIKPLAMIMAVVSGAVTYFIAKYGVAIDASMIANAIHTDATEVKQLLSWQMVPYVAFLIVLPMSIVGLSQITFATGGRYLLSSLKYFSICVVSAVALLYANYTAIHRAGNVSNKYIVYSLVPVNVLSSVISVASRSLKSHFKADPNAVQISGRVAATDNLVVVLAIGETSRRKNFSLYGYARRNTTPTLDRVRDLHLLDGVAARGTTLDALPDILEKNDIKLTTVVSKLGIPTSCYVNYTLYDNCAAVGEAAVKECGHDGKCYDEDVIPLLRSALQSYRSGQRFVVLHLGGGSHGPTYSDRYPPEFQQFKPLCEDADVANQCTLEQIYNSYDNSILYVDHVLGGIIDALDASRAPYGESLLEDGRMFHGMPPGIALPPEQANIPLIVKSSVPISIVDRAEYRQQDVFDTVLDLLSIETTQFDKLGSFVKKAS